MKPEPAKMSPEAQLRWAREILALKAASEPRAWEKIARPKQLWPDHPRHHLPDENGFRCGCSGSRDWTTWVMMAGRGVGKTRAGANWALTMGLSEPDICVGVCAPTIGQVREVCFEGPSGIIKQAQPGEIVEYNKNNQKITLRNGSVIYGYSAEKEDSVRGANLSYCWFDELAMIRYYRFFDYALKPALRIKPRDCDPRIMITTTPKKMRLIREIIRQADKDPAKIHVTRARTDENPYFAKGALEDLRRQYKGTYMERQELEGELIEEADGALFNPEDFNDYRLEPGNVPELRRIVVAIDPATTSSDRSDETGIIIAGEGIDHHFYTLEDCSLRGSPDQCMSVVAAAYHRWEADLVIGEKQGVGDYMRELLSHKDPNIPFKPVMAMKGKLMRAESVSLLCAQGRIHMVGDDFGALEEQLVSVTPNDDRSAMHDDRADAWVWAMRELSGRASGSYKEMYGFVPCKKCGEDVNEYLDKKCRHCGTPISEMEKPKERDRAVRWHNAYAKVCPDGHSYPVKEPYCPHCRQNPGSYLSQVARFATVNSGWHSYAGKDWLSGRRP